MFHTLQHHLWRDAGNREGGERERGGGGERERERVGKGRGRGRGERRREGGGISRIPRDGEEEIEEEEEEEEPPLPGRDDVICSENKKVTNK